MRGLAGFKVLKGTPSNISIAVLADPYFCIEDDILHFYRTTRGNKGNGRLRALDVVTVVNRCSLFRPLTLYSTLFGSFDESVLL